MSKPSAQSPSGRRCKLCESGTLLRPPLALSYRPALKNSVPLCLCGRCLSSLLPPLSRFRSFPLDIFHSLADALLHSFSRRLVVHAVFQSVRQTLHVRHLFLIIVRVLIRLPVSKL